MKYIKSFEPFKINEGKFEDYSIKHPNIKDLLMRLKSESFSPGLLDWVVKNKCTIDDLQTLLDLEIARKNNLFKIDINKIDKQKLKEILFDISDNIVRIKNRSNTKPIFESGELKIFKLTNYDECNKILSDSDICVSKTKECFDRYSFGINGGSKIGNHQFYVIDNGSTDRFRRVVIGVTDFITILYDSDDSFLNDITQIIKLELPEERSIWKDWTLSKCIDTFDRYSEVENYFNNINSETLNFLFKECPGFEQSLNYIKNNTKNKSINGFNIIYIDLVGDLLKIIIRRDNLTYYLSYDINSSKLVKINKDTKTSIQFKDLPDYNELFNYYSNLFM